jgi:magnesium transporter
MAMPAKKSSRKAGLPPGTLVHIGEKHVEKPRITVMDYDDGTFQEKEVAAVEECFEFKETSTVTWINVEGLHDVGIIEKLGSRFGLHPLIQEDILNTAERPKMEDYGDHIFLLLKVFVLGNKNHDEKIQQVSLVLGSNFVISFQEKESGVFDPVRDRIRKDKGRLRKLGPDYLAYALIDSIVDGYFGFLEKLSEEIELLED